MSHQCIEQLNIDTKQNEIATLQTVNNVIGELVNENRFIYFLYHILFQRTQSSKQQSINDNYSSNYNDVLSQNVLISLRYLMSFDTMNTTEHKLVICNSGAIEVR
jgi:hypothetical protein